MLLDPRRLLEDAATAARDGRWSEVQVIGTAAVDALVGSRAHPTDIMLAQRLVRQTAELKTTFVAVLVAEANHNQLTLWNPG